MWPAKKTIEIKACVEKFLHRICHALTHDEVLWFETIAIELDETFSRFQEKSSNKWSNIILQMDTLTHQI